MDVRTGDVVKVRRGEAGEGYVFVVESVVLGGFGEPVVYGRGYGPRRASEVELVRKGGA